MKSVLIIFQYKNIGPTYTPNRIKSGKNSCDNCIADTSKFKKTIQAKISGNLGNCMMSSSGLY